VTPHPEERQSGSAQIKVVINEDGGTFRLSHKALMRLAELKGISLRIQNEDPSHGIYYEQYYWVHVDGTETRYDLMSLRRDDVALIQVVEELGVLANTDGSELSIVTVPGGIPWRILTVAGFEVVISDDSI
jgi:hypothetical protein